MSFITYLIYAIGIVLTGWKLGNFQAVVMILCLILFELIKIRNLLGG